MEELSKFVHSLFVDEICKEPAKIDADKEALLQDYDSRKAVLESITISDELSDDEAENEALLENYDTPKSDVKKGLHIRKRLTKFSEKLKQLVEDDHAKMIGKPVINRKMWLWMVLDFFLIQLIIGPCSVLIWRGGWEFFDYIFGMNFYTGIGLFFFGLLSSIPVIIYSSDLSLIAEEILMDKSHRCGSFCYVSLTRLYSAVTFFAMLFFWKGWFDIGLVFSIPNWNFSLACLVLGSLVLMYLGCFKTAALCPPMGVWLDTATHYVHVDQFYDVRDTEEKSMQFRMYNAVLTLAIEVISLVTCYGANSLIENWLYLKIFEIFGSSLQASGFMLVWAVLLSGISYVSSILYLYINFELGSTYWNPTLKTLCYDAILLVLVFAKALHFNAWWGVTDMIKQEAFGDYAYSEIIFLVLGFLITVFLGVGSGDHFGVSWEKAKEEDGILLPFIYLTYILRDKRDSKDDRVVDNRAHLIVESLS